MSGWSLENAVSVDGYTMTWKISSSGPGKNKFFRFSKISRLALGAHKSPMQWSTEAPSQRYSGRSVTLNAHLYLLSRFMN